MRKLRHIQKQTRLLNEEYEAKSSLLKSIEKQNTPNGMYLINCLLDDLEDIQNRLKINQKHIAALKNENLYKFNHGKLNRLDDQQKIEHALTNLINTFGRDAVIEANKSLKLTRKANTKRKVA